MADKKPAGSPDFNDEYLAYGLDEFTRRLKSRIKKSITSDVVDSGLPNDMPPGPPSDESSSWQWLFLTGRDGPKGCAQNVTLIFQNDTRWAGVFAENVFTGAIDIAKPPPIEEIDIGELQDPHVAMIHVWIEENYKIVVQDAAMRKALITVAAKHRYHPVKDYLNGLPVWDGVDRCSTWLKESLGCKNEPLEYLAAVGTKFLVGAVRRIMQAPVPVKVDNMLVFEGLQGGGKSSLVEALFTPWHGDTPLPLGDKDSYINIRGSWGYEIAEMDSFNKAATSTAKSFLSSHTDNFRPPFGTKNVKYPRQTVFIGSVNHSEYMTDSSGNRRYWPLYAYLVSISWLKLHREQLWAEALVRCQNNESHWVDKKLEPELAKMIKYEQTLREHPDAWEAALWVWMDNGLCTKDHYSSVEILSDVIKLDLRSINKSHEMKLSAAMQKLEWEKVRKRVEGYKSAKPYLYVPPKWAITRRTGYQLENEGEIDV